MALIGGYPVERIVLAPSLPRVDEFPPPEFSKIREKGGRKPEGCAASSCTCWTWAALARAGGACYA